MLIQRFFSFARREVVKSQYLTNPITGKEIKLPVIVKDETINIINDNYYNRKFVGYKSDKPGRYIFKK